MTTLIQHTNQANGRPTTMTKQQTTTTPSMNQAPALPASEANPTLENFLSVVFGEIPKDERGLFWASTKEAPGYPVEKTKFDRLMGGKGQRAAYFGTATMYPNDEGKLRNKQDLFAAQYVVVLDDIGTGLGAKVLEKELPAGLRERATYIIETSPDNYQWGFVLEDPIEHLALAKAFTKLFVTGAGADTGGCMPNKLVRLPCGYNLKEKYANGTGLFACRLVELNPDRLCKPDDLLELVDAGVQLKDLGNIDRLQASRLIGRSTTAWRDSITMEGAGGVVDPVLEWLNKHNMVADESNEWITIRCPWADNHTSGDGTAGYKPVGYGVRQDLRAFHCFHDHCSGHKTGEFLNWLADMGGPKVSIIDPVPELVARYALDMASKEMVDMQSKELRRLSDGGFKLGNMQDIWVNVGEGKVAKGSAYGWFLKDPGLMKLHGQMRQPGDARILRSEGNYFLNSWALPYWGHGDYSQAQVDPFLDFIHYLLPNGDDAEFFLDHVAAKAQNPQYRGPGLIMTTPVQGTGRGTLEAMLGQLWGAWNVAAVSLSALVKGLDEADNNAFIRSDWLIVPEAKESSMTGRQEGRAYETLKSYIEPGAVNRRIKVKYIPEWFENCYGSVIICSQHKNVLNTEMGDSRFRRMANTVKPRSYEYFVGLRAWMSGGFEAHVWRWLLARDLSGHDAFARQAVAAVGDQVERAMDSGSPVDMACALIVGWGHEREGVVSISRCVGALSGLSYELGLSGIASWERIVKRELKTRLLPVMAGGEQIRVRANDGQQCRLSHVIGGGQLIGAMFNGGRQDIKQARELSQACLDMEGFIAYCREALDC